MTASATRRFVADGQVLQTGARFRGMGHYALELVAALSAVPDVELELVLTRHLPTHEVVRTLRQRAPRVQITRADLRLDVPDDPAVLRHNRAVVDRLLSERPADTTFLLLSALQAIIRPALPTARPTWALVYDLLPWMSPDTLLRQPRQRREYADRLRELLRADGFLTISRTVAGDLAGRLGVDAGRIVVIDGAPVPHGAPAAKGPAGVEEPFVLLPTGNDPRKNNQRAVEAFARFNSLHAGAYQLVVTSGFRAEERAALRALAPRVHFTGSVPGPTLTWLYAHAATVLFPPEAEGLGLPVLEALAADVPVACSDIPVFTEISRSAWFLFDPRSVPQMADALHRAVLSGRVPRGEREAILARYSWPRVARTVVDGTAHGPRPGAADDAPAGVRATSTLRLRLVGPDVGDADPAGNVLVTLHAELSRRAQVDYRITSGPGIGSAFLPRAGRDPRRSVFVLSGAASGALALFLALGSAGVVYLLDTDLTAAWRALAGRLSPSRQAAEDRLSGFEVAGTAHTVALLAAARLVLVPDAAARDRLVAVAGRAGLPTRVEVLPPPVPVPPFPGLLGADPPADDHRPARVADRLVELVAGL